MSNEAMKRTQATQAEVTDEQIKEAAVRAAKDGKLSWLGFDKDDQDRYTIPVLSKSHYQFARAILPLRPVQVPMTPDEIVNARDEAQAHNLLSFMKGVRAAEAHHFGITAQAKKETP